MFLLTLSALEVLHGLHGYRTEHRAVSDELVRICHSIIDFDIEQPETR